MTRMGTFLPGRSLLRKQRAVSFIVNNQKQILAISMLRVGSSPSWVIDAQQEDCFGGSRGYLEGSRRAKATGRGVRDRRRNSVIDFGILPLWSNGSACALRYNALERIGSASPAGWNIEFAENQAAIRLGEDGRTVLVLRSAAISSRGSRHRGQKAARVYGRPPPSSIPWRAGAREQSACLQILQFAQGLAECRTISTVGTCLTVRQGKAR
jgi:hypothetical protein